MIRFLSANYKRIIHVLLWIIFFMFNVSYFSSFQGTQVAVVRGVLVLLIYLAVFYSNWFYLIPRFYIRKKYFLFVILSILFLLTSAVIRIGVEKWADIIPLIPRQPMIEHKIIRQLVIAFGMSGIMFIISFIFRLTEYYMIESRQSDILMQQKTEAELKLLKAQINPHFLFNALNNIYALVLTKSDNAADSLMALSQLLRYIIYDAAAEKVSLVKEITYLKYYIDLESLRLPDRSRLEVDITGAGEDCRIMPLIFIPFVENCFKHSNINKGGYIKISLDVQEKTVLFACENSYATVAKSVDTTEGVGLTNCKRRLEILYPENFTMEITDRDNIFKTELSIRL